MFKMHIGHDVGDKVTDEAGTWEVVAVDGKNVHWKLIEEPLPPEIEKKIELHIQPEFTAWRRQLLRNIPIVMTSNKRGYSDVFYKPLKKFIKDHQLADRDGKVTLNPFTTETERLRLLYQLFLLYDHQLKWNRRFLPEPSREELLETSAFTAKVNKEENANLQQKIYELETREEERPPLHPHLQSPCLVFDSDSDDE